VNYAKMNAACGREGALGDDGFVANKGTSKGAAAFMNSSGWVGVFTVIQLLRRGEEACFTTPKYSITTAEDTRI